MTTGTRRDEEGDHLRVISAWELPGEGPPSRLHETSGGWTFSRGDQIYSPQINGKIVGPKPTVGCPGICFFSTSMIRLLEFPHGLKSGDHYNSISPSNDGKNMGMILWPLV